MPNEQTPFEKYLAGEPLNEELAALQRGAERAAVNPFPPSPSYALAVNGDPERELTNTERLDLKEMRLSPGWPVMQRLFQKLFAIHHKSAITLSQYSPLENRDKIAEEWAYVVMYRRAIDEFNKLAATEVAELEKEAR